MSVLVGELSHLGEYVIRHHFFTFLNRITHSRCSSWISHCIASFAVVGSAHIIPL